VATFVPGAIPTISGGGFYDLLDLDNASATFNIDGLIEGEGATVSSVTVMKSYTGHINDSTIVTGPTVEHVTIPVSEIPKSITVTANEAAQNADADFTQAKVEDHFNFTFVLNTEDGRALKSGPTISVPLSCPSALAGTYSVVTSGNQGAGSGTTSGTYEGVEATVVIAEVAPGTYSVDDITGGMYPGVWGDIPVPGEISDVCNNITIQNTVDHYQDTFSGTGTVNADGTITITWNNGYGDDGVSVYTPQ